MHEETEALDAALALLTLITGDDWDRAKLLEQSGQLRAVAVHTLRKQGLTEDDADTFVEDRWRGYAADILPAVPSAPAEHEVADPSPSTQTDGDLSAMANVEANAATIPDLAELRARLSARREA